MSSSGRAVQEPPPASPIAGDWAAVLELLDEITGEESMQISFHQFSDALQGTSYESITIDQFLERFRLNILAMIGGVRQRRVPGMQDDPVELQNTGRSRAIGGVELSDMVRITLLAQSTFVSQLTALARRHGITDTLIIELLQYLDAWHAWTMKELLWGFQEYALAMITRDLRRQDRALRQLLGGGLTPVEVGRAAAECGLDPHGSYLVLRVVSGDRSAGDVRRALVNAGLPASEQLPMTTMYGDVCLIASGAPSGDVPFVVGVSPSMPVSALSEGFRLATRSAEAARRTGRTGFVTMRDLSIVASVAVDHEVVHVLRRRYLEPLLELGAAGQVILDTVAEYLRRRRSVAETGHALFVHVNTVRYRLERFESMTGCSLKDIRTMAEVWWILHAEES